MMTSEQEPAEVDAHSGRLAGDPTRLLGRGSPRVTAAIEVVLCSGFPTQILLALTFSLLGLAAFDATGALSLTWVVVVSLVDAVLVLCLIFYFLYRNGEDAVDMFLGTRPVRRELMLGLFVLTPVVLGLAAVSIGTLHYLWPQLRNVPENPLEAFLQSPLSAGIFAVVAVVAGGIREELQRAFILRRFEQHLGGGWLGLVLFSVAFGLGHQIQGWDAAVVTGLLGAFWGALYLVRRSVASTIASHAGFNLTEILLALAGFGAATGAT